MRLTDLLRRNILPGLLLALAVPASAAAGAEGRWSTAAPMQMARAAHAVVATEAGIFALAGTGTGGRPVLALERFDGQRWQTLGELPGQGLNAPAAVALNGQLYLIGGFSTTTNRPSAQVLRYDLKTQAWDEVAPLPAPRGGHAAVVLDGRIHVLGGGNDQRTLDLHTRYDPASGRWQDLAPLPRSQGSPAATVLNGRIYAVGGRSGNADFGNVYIYDPAADRWTEGPALTPRGTAGAVSACGDLLLFGGESQARNISLDEAWHLNLQAGRWEPLPPMPTPRNFARAVNFQGAVYVVGGSPTPGSSHDSAGSAVVERFERPCPA